MGFLGSQAGIRGVSKAYQDVPGGLIVLSKAFQRRVNGSQGALRGV